MPGFADLWIQYHTIQAVHKEKLIPAELAFSWEDYPTQQEKSFYCLQGTLRMSEFLSCFESWSLNYKNPAAKKIII